MARLEDLTTGTRVTGLIASRTAAVESAQWIGEQGLKVTFRDADGGLGERFVYRDDEPSLELVEMGLPFQQMAEFSQSSRGGRCLAFAERRNPTAAIK